MPKNTSSKLPAYVYGSPDDGWMFKIHGIKSPLSDWKFVLDITSADDESKTERSDSFFMDRGFLGVTIGPLLQNYERAFLSFGAIQTLTKVEVPGTTVHRVWMFGECWVENYKIGQRHKYLLFPIFPCEQEE